MMQTLGGTAVVNKFYSYSLDSDGFLTTNIKFGTANSGRYQEIVQDRYRRVVKTRRPGFNVSGSPVVPDSIEESVFDPATNRLTKTVSTGYANTLYVYGPLGNLERQGLDLNGTGVLELSSSDRVTDYSSTVILDAGAYWLQSEVWTYPTAGVGTPQLVSSSRERLTTFAPDVLEESRTTNEDGRVETRTVAINRTTSKIRATNVRTSSGSSATSYEESTDGRLCEVLTFDGILHKYTYDFLGRAETENNPRLAAATHGGLITKLYYPGTYTIKSATQSTSLTPRTLFFNNGFDSVGRLTVATNANGDVTHRAFSPRGELLRVWGDGANPSESGYNGLGENTSITTWPESVGVWNTDVWPTVQGSSTVQMTYEPASGLLHKRIDASNSEVEYWYNERGQVSQRMWARKLADNLTRVKTTYTYFAGTGELSGKSYNDSPVTNSVSFTYTRAGLASNIYDVRGSEVSYYHSAQKFRLINKSIPGFYGTRAYSATYDSAGRYVGFKIGTDAVPDADFSQTYVLSDSDRINRVEMKRASTTYSHSYSYHANSPLLSGYSSSGSGFTVDMGYETDRDLAASITSRNSALNPISSFLYEREANGQRKLVTQSGFSVSDFGGTIVQEYTYTSRGEIIGADGKLQVGGGSPEPMPGRNHDYKYDNAGNRLHVRRSMVDSDKDLYSTNSNGQYVDRENAWMHTAGTVAGPGIAVSASGGGITALNATQRRESYWYQKVPISNGSPTTTTVTFTATNPGAGTGGADLVRTASKTLVVPAKVQDFTYDLDGNLLSDGLWDYSWDAENRLVEMKSTQSAVSGGHPNRTLSFVYDYLGRRVQKRVVDGSTVLLSRRYLYDGWNLIAEFAVNENLTCGALLRSYAWGLDSESVFSTNGSGGSLLQITDHTSNETYFPSYDGNGNLVALTQASTGALVASYEYSPFGELLRCEGSYAKANPFRFSTKFVDDETGLVYFGYRYYDARNGRFISRDPIWESGGNNLYSYVGNDPVNGRDTLGLFGASDGMYDPFWDDPTFGDIWLRFGLPDWDWGYGGFVDPRMPVAGRPPLRSPRGLNFGTTRLSRSGLVFFNSEEAVAPNNGTSSDDSSFEDIRLERRLRFGSIDAIEAAAYNPDENLAHLDTFAAIVEFVAVQHLMIKVADAADIAIGRGGALPAEDFAKRAAPSRDLVMHQDQLIINAYQRYYNEGWQAVVQRFLAGKIKIPAGQNWKTILGRELDGYARARLRAFLEREGISEGRGMDVLLNRYLRNPADPSDYRIPDVRLLRTGTILDGTIGEKTMNTPQIQDFIRFSGGNKVIIIKPEIRPTP
jgi:RHS repeat-associated protein